jgi:beta-N-acetylhexosaminidase
VTPRPGRSLALGYEGTSPPDALFSFASRFGLGGVILFARNCPDAPTVAAATASFRQGMAEADPESPALVLVDQEGGRVERIREGVPRLPPARSFGADPEGEQRLSEAVAAQARALANLGIDVNLAPVCDVAQEGESGAIGDRSFGADPALVGRLAAAHVRATLRGGLLPCAKHFPGHGAARVDSHRELPRLGKTLAELEATDLQPFRAAVEAGAPLVMAGHLLCPAVSASPATLCRTWLEKVLRQKLGFGGAVVSDDMEMGALAGLGTMGEVAVRAVRAGCDLLIYGRMLQPKFDPVPVAQVLAADVPAERLAEAEGRVRRLAAKRAGGRGPPSAGA